MICSSGIGFDPICDGRRLTFGFHGIWQGTAVLYDHQTMSRWLHMTGECIEGKLKGKTLRPIPGRHQLWREWKRDHPDGELALPDPKFASLHFDRMSARRGLVHFPPGFKETIQTRDERFPLAQLCYGVKAGASAKAYAFSELAKVKNGLVNDQVGGTPVVIVFDKDSSSASGYGRVLDGETLIFERTADGDLRDTKSGSVFGRHGQCTRGRYQGRQLPAVHGLQAEWYGWYATYPRTEVFRARK